jgi:hypothetical protein
MKYTDPTGRVPVLDESGQFMMDTASSLIDQAGNTDSKLAAAGLGFMAGANYLAGGVVEGVNFGLNILGADGYLGGGVQQRAQGELNEAFGSIQTVVENPKAVVSQVVTSATNTVKGVAAGDPKSIAQAVAVATGMLGGKPNANVATLATSTGEVVRKAAIGGAAVMRNTVKPVSNWYKSNKNVRQINKNSKREIDTVRHDESFNSRGIESQAKILHEMRVTATDGARNLMPSNEARFLDLRDIAKYKNPNGRRDFNAFYEYKRNRMIKINPDVTKEAVFQSIIDSSGKSNRYVDLFFGVK